MVQFETYYWLPKYSCLATLQTLSSALSVEDPVIGDYCVLASFVLLAQGN